MAAWKPLPEPQDRRALNKKISTASANNTRITTNNLNREQKTRLNAEVKTIEIELENVRKRIRNRKLAIGNALEKAKWPVPGLGFKTQEEGSNNRELKNPKKVVTYNGLPLREASTGEQIRVSAAIGMAGRANLTCVFYSSAEGSLLQQQRHGRARKDGARKQLSNLNRGR